MIRIFGYVVLGFSIIVLSACGTTGETRSFILDLQPNEEANIIVDVSVDTVEFDHKESYLEAVNVQPWGKFDFEDLRNIESSLNQTLTRNLLSDSSTIESKLDIHLFIRRYIVTVSNTGGGVLATVTWAVTDGEGALVFDEQFYAWDSGYLVTTAGLIKDSVHKQIVRRIVTTAMILASGRSLSQEPPISIANTSTSLDEAISNLPGSFVSMGSPILVGVPVESVQTIGLLTPSGSTDRPWEKPPLSKRFDWPSYLESVLGSQESAMEKTKEDPEALARSIDSVANVENQLPASFDLSGTYVSTYTGKYLKVSPDFRTGNLQVRLALDGKKITGTFGSAGKVWGDLIDEETIKFELYATGGYSRRGIWKIYPATSTLQGKMISDEAEEWDLTKIQ